MPLILDPKRSIITIHIYFIEEKRDHGNTIIHFIRNKDEFELWKAKGYKLRNEVDEYKKEPSPVSLESKPKPKNTESEEKYIDILKTHWKQLTFKDEITLSSQSLRNVVGQEGSTYEIDLIRFRELKLKSCLVGWDAKDENGYPIPINEETIDNMRPDLARELLDTFNKVISPTN